MFFDFSIKKLTAITLLAFLVVGGAYASLSLGRKFHFSEEASWIWNRNKSEALYQLSYKIPRREAPVRRASNPVSILASVGEFFDSLALDAVLTYDKNHVEEPQEHAGALVASAPPSSARSVPVLVYHGEGDGAGNVPIRVFADHMHALKQDGWNTLTLKQFVSFMKESEPVPDKSFLLTFDDGRKDSFYPADPVLQDLGFTAVMFVVTDYSLPAEKTKESDFYLSRRELQKMIESKRWETESHGKADHLWYQIVNATNTDSMIKTTKPGHFLSNKFWISDESRFETDEEFADRIHEDLLSAKRALQTNFGKPVTTFAYPFNDFGQETINFPGARSIIEKVVKDLYELSFYQVWPSGGDTFNIPDPQAFMAKRIEPFPEWSAEKLLSVLNGGRTKELPYEKSAFEGEWTGTWGSVRSDGLLTFGATSGTSGARAILQGSRWWKDYSFTVRILARRGSHVSLLSRQKDSKNYLACAFSNTGVTLEEHRGETTTLYTRKNYEREFPAGPISLGMEVKENAAGCSLDGDALIEDAPVSSALDAGGVAIEVWNQELGFAGAIIDRVSITAR